MSRKPSQASHAELGGSELNLSPILALLVILIPMLLAMFNFFEVKVQAVAAPKLGPHVAKGDVPDQPPSLTVQISSQGFVLRQHGAEQNPAPIAIPKDRFEGAGATVAEDFDYPALYTELLAKKQRYPDARTINIAAEMDIPWHIIARTIDAARVELEEPRFAGRDRMKRFVAANAKTRASQADTNGDGAITDADREQVTMFPRVVFVVADN